MDVKRLSVNRCRSEEDVIKRLVAARYDAKLREHHGKDAAIVCYTSSPDVVEYKGVLFVGDDSHFYVDQAVLEMPKGDVKMVIKMGNGLDGKR